MALADVHLHCEGLVCIFRSELRHEGKLLGSFPTNSIVFMQQNILYNSS
jgi:hypothetical protein